MKILLLITNYEDYKYSLLIYHLMGEIFEIHYYFFNTNNIFKNNTFPKNINEKYFDNKINNEEMIDNINKIIVNYELIISYNIKSIIFNNNVNNKKTKYKCFINIVYSEKAYYFNYKPNINYFIIYLNKTNHLKTIFSDNIQIDFNNIFEKISQIRKNNDNEMYKMSYPLLLCIINKMFIWFNYKYLYINDIINNTNEIKNINNDSLIIHNNKLFLKGKKTYFDNTDAEWNRRGKILNNYIQDYGIQNVKYIVHFLDHFDNFNWVEKFKYPIFCFNRSKSNKNGILFQLENYQDFITIRRSKKNIIIPFRNKIKKMIGYYSQLGGYSKDDDWFQIGRSDEQIFKNIQNIDYNTAFLLLSNFDRFKVCYNYRNNELFELGLLDNVELGKTFKTFFPFLIKHRKTIEEMCQYMFHLCIGGNDWATSLFWQLCNHNVVFIPYPFEYESIFHFGLQPFVHFVPISNKLFDIEEKLKYMINNIELCEKISTNAYNYSQLFLENNCEFLDNISKNTLEVYNHYYEKST